MDIPGVIVICLPALAVCYAAMILCFTLPLRRKPLIAAPAEDDLPFVSVVVAARNEERNIRRCLESILEQDYPADRFEVIVSDDHSTDRTKAEALLAANSNLAVRLTLLEAGAGAGAGKKRAVERAVRAAKGPWILTTDADTGREAGWLSTMATEALAPGTRMVLGPVRIEGASCFGKLQALEFAGVMGLTAGSAGAGSSARAPDPLRPPQASSSAATTKHSRFQGRPVRRWQWRMGSSSVLGVDPAPVPFGGGPASSLNRSGITG